MTDDLVRSLRTGGPVSPAIQMRMLLQFGRQRGWEFDAAWRWSFERIRWPHDTSHRLEWKSVLGKRHDDPAKVPAQQREAWRSAYEHREQTSREQSVGLLVAA